jgi:hypothetical protein
VFSLRVRARVDVAIDVANETHGRENKRYDENARGDDSGGEATDKKSNAQRMCKDRSGGAPRSRDAWFFGYGGEKYGYSFLAMGEKFKNHPRARDTATRVTRSSVATRTHTHARRDTSFARARIARERRQSDRRRQSVKAFKRAHSVVEFCI